MRRVGDLGEALRCQHDGRVLLPQGPKPFLDFCAERAVGEHDPSLVEDDKGRPAVQALIDAVEEICDDWNDHLRSHRHQRLQLESDKSLFEQDILVGVQKASERTGQRECVQAVAHGVVLDLRDEIADRPMFGRALGDQFKRAPQRPALRWHEPTP